MLEWGNTKRIKDIALFTDKNIIKHLLDDTTFDKSVKNFETFLLMNIVKQS